MIFVLSLLIILISILLAVFGVKYNKTKQNLKTVAAQKAAVEQSLSERESLFADEKGSLNGEISKLNEQVSLKREQESRALAEANAGKVVYLTFDDGPSKYTPRILDSLEANGGRATFFMVGNRVASYASTVKRMADLGCETDSHTWAHTYLTGMSEGEILQSLNQTRDAIVAAGGNAPKGVRPPGGKINDASKAVLAKAGMPSIIWSVDTLDWKTRNAQNTINVVLNQVKDGDIVLMHDIYSTSADAAEVIIPELVNRGYQLVTVSEMAQYRGGIQAGHVYNRFRP